MAHPPTLLFLGKGKSLWPLAQPGCLVEISPIEGPIRSGDLVAYCGERSVICHRVLSVRIHGQNQWFLCKGDGNLEADGWIPDYRLLGIVSKLDGKSIQRFSFWVLSHFFFFLSICQWKIYEKWFRPLRSHPLSVQAI